MKLYIVHLLLFVSFAFGEVLPCQDTDKDCGQTTDHCFVLCSCACTFSTTPEKILVQTWLPSTPLSRIEILPDLNTFSSIPWHPPKLH